MKRRPAEKQPVPIKAPERDPTPPPVAETAGEQQIRKIDNFTMAAMKRHHPGQKAARKRKLLERAVSDSSWLNAGTQTAQSGGGVAPLAEPKPPLQPQKRRATTGDQASFAEPQTQKSRNNLLTSDASRDKRVADCSGASTSSEETPRKRMRASRSNAESE